MKSRGEPIICVGIIDRAGYVSGRLDGRFFGEGSVYLTGAFSARTKDGQVELSDDAGLPLWQSPTAKLTAEGAGTFALLGVTIGDRFHWERQEDQVFNGNLLFVPRSDGTVSAINEIPIEAYLTSVISSEMRPEAPIEFLKAHAIMSRSWLMAALNRKGERDNAKVAPHHDHGGTEGNVIRWYDREDHDVFDVCADDHCQRYHGLTRIISTQAEAAVAATSGMVMTYKGTICDARYSKCCGGITEEFQTAWDETKIDYLASVTDWKTGYDSITTEDRAHGWILSRPGAYCNTQNDRLLEKILPDFDRETRGFFRWSLIYKRAELEEIIREKSGIDFGRLIEIAPLKRGPSGRIYSLRIVGTKRAVTVGKELEIRRWLSPSHLYSSAFTVLPQNGDDGLPETFTFFGAGWGHGVGLCQIGAAVMADRGASCEEILKHYFRGVHIERAY